MNIINTILVQGNKNCLFFNISVLSRCINHEGAGCSCTFKYWLVFNEYPLKKNTKRESEGSEKLKQTNTDKAFSSYCHFQNMNLSLFNGAKIIPNWLITTARRGLNMNRNEMEQFRGTYSPRGEGIYTLTEQFPRCVPSCHQLFSVQSILRPHEGNKTSAVHKYMHVTH